MLTRKFKECYDMMGKPIKCIFCNHDKHYAAIKDTINGEVAEAEIICLNCNKSIAYWAYGYFDSSYINHKILPYNKLYLNKKLFII